MSASVPAAVTALSATFFFARLKRAFASGPLSGTVRVRPAVHTLVVAGTSPVSALWSAARSASFVPLTVTALTSAGAQPGNAGSALRRQTSTSKTQALFATPSRSQAASPSRQRTSLPAFGFAGSKGG